MFAATAAPSNCSSCAIVIRVGNESVGIQLAPLAMILTPLTTNWNDLPQASGSWRSSSVRRPMRFSLTSSAAPAASSRVTRTV